MKKIAILIYDQMELLDMSGIQTAFFTANQQVPGSYQLSTIGFDAKTVTCESGTRIIPDSCISTLDDEHALDEEHKSNAFHTLIIPGGKGARLNLINSDHSRALKLAIGKCERIVTVCTGIFLLANLGLVKGTHVATHWAYVDQFKCSFPHLQVDRDKLFIRDKLCIKENRFIQDTQCERDCLPRKEQQLWSSAGVTSGIDLALRLIELDINRATAINVAQYLVVYLKRSGSQQQFSGLLDMQIPKSDVIASVINWIKENLGKHLSVQQMADRANLSERQFRRLFMRDTGKTPANYLEELRMDSAKNLLLNSDKSIKQLALTLGFNSADGFRRAFERKYSVSPSQYRLVFNGDSFDA